ncbi:hypothetical protein H4219_004432 [Mycoemilia scoparia]|uniref:Uncharacterized protein n=1 Tax=Mycoemilia scoparia TaxID=417184 RepID=A0A9W7ZXE6_9FUNG|nr:hypothetical protein H4219_004432 [Mycoemilia scoparia]
MMESSEEPLALAQKFIDIIGPIYATSGLAENENKSMEISNKKTKAPSSSSSRSRATEQSKSTKQSSELVPSHYEWAFHSSVDKKGFLSWFTRHITTESNALTKNELKLLEKLDKREVMPNAYSHNSQKSSDSKQEQASIYTSELDLLERDEEIKQHLHKMTQYKDVFEHQKQDLSDQEHELLKELQVLESEEDDLRLQERHLDNNLNLISVSHDGLLEETAMEMKRMLDTIKSTAPSNPVSTQDGMNSDGNVDDDDGDGESQNGIYYYQLPDFLRQICELAQSYLDIIHTVVENQTNNINAYPTSWESKTPYGTKNIKELIDLATQEYNRLAITIPKAKVEQQNLQAQLIALEGYLKGAENIAPNELATIVERIAQSEDIIPDNNNNTNTNKEPLFELTPEFIKTLQKPTTTQISDQSISKDLDKLKKSIQDLVQIQKEMQDQGLTEIILQVAQVSIYQAIVNELLNIETEQLYQWQRLWTPIINNLSQRQNRIKNHEKILGTMMMTGRSSSGAVMDGSDKKDDPNEHTFTQPGDDILITVRQMLDIANETDNDNGDEFDEQNADEAPIPTNNGGMFASIRGIHQDAETLTQKVRDQEAKFFKLLDCHQSNAKTLQSLVGKIRSQCFGGIDVGTEAPPSFLPLSIWDTMVSMKSEANKLRKSVTKATMLDKQQSVDLDKLYTELFNIFYSEPIPATAPNHDSGLNLETGNTNTNTNKEPDAVPLADIKLKKWFEDIVNTKSNNSNKA